jgi:hypothetical protein
LPCNESRQRETQAGKKIPAFRRANDTPFNVSERPANENRVSGDGATLLLTVTPAERELCRREVVLS